MLPVQSPPQILMVVFAETTVEGFPECGLCGVFLPPIHATMMTTENETPRKAGWYWDPQENVFNAQLKKYWNQWDSSLDIVKNGREERQYRLRYWDGSQWTKKTRRSRLGEEYLLRKHVNLRTADSQTYFRVASTGFSRRIIFSGYLASICLAFAVATETIL